jgi:hypothetical protein
MAPRGESARAPGRAWAVLSSVRSDVVNVRDVGTVVVCDVTLCG